MDLPDVAGKFESLRLQFKSLGVELIPISAVSQYNLRELMWKVFQTLAELPERKRKLKCRFTAPEVDPNAFEIEKTEDGYVVSGHALRKPPQ
jgi:hypothetical protein